MFKILDYDLHSYNHHIDSKSTKLPRVASLSGTCDTFAHIEAKW